MKGHLPIFYREYSGKRGARFLQGKRPIYKNDMDAIKYVSNEKAEITAIIIDLCVLKQEGLKSADVINVLGNLDELIAASPSNEKKKSKDWAAAKAILGKSDLK